MQHLPWHGILPHLWIVAQLHPLRRAGVGSAPPWRFPSGYPLPLQGLDAEGPQHGPRQREQGRLLGCLGALVDGG